MDAKQQWDTLSEEARFELGFAAAVYGCCVGSQHSPGTADLKQLRLVNARGYITLEGCEVYNAGNPSDDLRGTTIIEFI
jgi:hypothetical protein